MPTLLNYFINAQSEGFTFAQSEFAKIGIELTPRENGILVAQTTGTDPTLPGLIVDAVKYTIIGGGTYILSGEIIDDGVQVFNWIKEGSQFATLSFTVEELAVNPPEFPGLTEAPIQIESFPQGSTLEDILGTESIFWTPLEPINELSNNTESFPQRDQILEDLLNGGLFLGEEEVPQGTYFLAAETNPIILDLINSSSEPTITRKNTAIYENTNGGYEEAQRIFNLFKFSSVAPLPNSQFNGFVGILEDGRRIIIRDGSRGEINSSEPGPPTLEIQRADGGRVLRKFRFLN